MLQCTQSAQWIVHWRALFVSWMCVTALHLSTHTSFHVSSRLEMIYWMDPTLSPLIKHVSLRGSRLRSSSDPTWSTSTSLGSWSKFLLWRRCLDTKIQNTCLAHAVLLYTGLFQLYGSYSLPSVMVVTSGISSHGKLRGDVSCYNCFLICRQ